MYTSTIEEIYFSPYDCYVVHDPGYDPVFFDTDDASEQVIILNAQDDSLHSKYLLSSIEQPAEA